MEERMKKIVLSLLLLTTVPVLGAIPPEDYYNAGSSLFEKGDYPQAIRYFRAAIQAKTDFWQAYQYLGEAYYQTSNRTEAVVAIQESLRLHPNNPELKKFLSLVKSSSPWVPVDSWRGYLPVVSIVISLLSLGYMAFWTWRCGLWPWKKASSGE
jgi:tetratricopeptide (TPR) repeat protein